LDTGDLFLDLEWSYFWNLFSHHRGLQVAESKTQCGIEWRKTPNTSVAAPPPSHATPRHATPLIALQQEEKEYSVWSCEGFSLKL